MYTGWSNRIENESKLRLKLILDRLIKDLAFEELKMKKESHSKVKNLEHKSYEMQKYLKSNPVKITQEEAKEIFKLRSKVTEVKENFKGKYENIECELCKEEENQEHIMTCKELNKNEKIEKIPDFEEIYKGNITNQLKIVRK